MGKDQTDDKGLICRNEFLKTVTECIRKDMIQNYEIQ
jgi:hypothetical protein